MGIMKRISSYLAVTIITLILSIVSVKAENLSKQYNIECCQAMNEQIVYEATGSVDLYRKEMGLELKSVQRNGKYYITLSGTPSIIDGNVYFSGMTKDNYTTEVNYNIIVHVARKKINVTNTYNGVAGTNLGNILVYQVSNTDTLNPVNLTQNGVTLKTANVNGKYGLYLMGTPEKAGTIHFTGVTYNSNTTQNNYDINYNITVNVAAKTREVIEVTKSYNGTVGKSIGDILVYQSDKLKSISSTRNGLTLKTDTDGLRLSGTPTQPGTITFTGTTYEGDSYTIKFNVTITIPNPTKPSYKVEKLYNAVVNKDIGKVLIYESSKTLPDLEKTEKGITIKTETVDGKTKIYLTGKPTEEGKVIFSGTVDEGERDLIYYIIVTIKKANNNTSSGTNTNTSTNTNTNNNSNTNNSNNNNNTSNNTNSNTNNNNNTPSNSTNNNVEEETNNEAVDPIVEPNKEEEEETTIGPSKEEISKGAEVKAIEKQEEEKKNNLIIPIIAGVAVLIGLLVFISISNNNKKKRLETY